MRNAREVTNYFSGFCVIDSGDLTSARSIAHRLLGGPARDIVFSMFYTLKIFASEEVSDGERMLAEQRFRHALDTEIGDAALVWPVYQAWLKLYQQYADHPKPWPVNDAEQLLADQWEAAELAATHAAFGVNRYLGDAHFELSR